MIVVWAEDSSTNAWVNQEVGAALQKGIPVLPLIERGSSLKAMLEGAEGVYYDSGNPWKGVKEFVEKLEATLEQDGYQLVDKVEIETRLRELWRAYEEFMKKE